MYMRGFVFLLLIFILSCSCLGPKAPKIIYPDKNLQEIVMYGGYSSKNPDAVKELKKELLSKPRCPIDGSLVKDCGLYEGETFEEALKDHPDIGKERFSYTQSLYCYNKTEEDKIKPILNKNLRIRLYDKEENLLAEDFLREKYPDRSFTVSYLPYHDKGHIIRIVRLQGTKEVILFWEEMLSELELKKTSLFYRGGHSMDWTYDKKRKCHDSPSIK